LDKLSLLRAITGEQPLSFGSIAFNDMNLDSMTRQAGHWLRAAPPGDLSAAAGQENLESGLRP
jgi:hypothetical protein